MHIMCAKERSGATVILKALDEWEYPYESVTAEKGKLRVAVNLLGNDMEDIQKLIEKEKGEEQHEKNNS